MELDQFQLFYLLKMEKLGHMFGASSKQAFTDKKLILYYKKLIEWKGSGFCPSFLF